METPLAASQRTELTQEERLVIENWLGAHPYGVQDANGIDLSLLRENLKLTPTERLIRLERAANEIYEIDIRVRTKN